MKTKTFLAFLFLISFGARASINNTIEIVQPSWGCDFVFVFAIAHDTSSSSIVLRKWTLLNTNGSMIYSPTPNLDSNFAYLITSSNSCVSNYYVKLVSINTDGDSAVAVSQTINLYKSPEFYPVVQTNGCVSYDATLTLNYTDSCDILDSIGISWGDGTDTIATGGHVFIHHYPNGSDCYNIGIVAWNQYGCASDTLISDICFGLPIAGGYVNPHAALCSNPPILLLFTDTTNGVVDSLRWSFGDSTYAYTSNSSHIYADPLCHEIKLIIWGCGISDTAIIDTLCPGGPSISSYTVSAPYFCSCEDTAVFTYGTVGASKGTFLYGCSQGFVNDVFNPIGTTQNPTITQHTFKFCVRDSCQPHLMLRDAMGCQQYYDLPYVYVDSPQVHFTYSVNHDTVQFINQTLPGAENFAMANWSFGTGGNSSEFSPAYVFSALSTYYVCLTMSDSGGCARTFCDSVSLSLSTSIYSVDDNFDFSIYPNPATNQLFIDAHGANVKSVLLYGIDGKLMKEIKQLTENGIDISYLSKGVYIAEIHTTPKSPKGDFNTVIRRWVKM